MTSIEDHRHFYARLVVGSAGSSDQRLISAFASIARERFLGNGPWLVAAGEYILTPSNNPEVLYQDIVVAIAPERRINNGQPRLHALCLAACAPAEGETAVHIGAGTGYYTAILAKLVGPTGSVVAYEIEKDIADRARALLSDNVNVSVFCGSASDVVLPKANIIYVSAGATHPPSSWLDALAIGGRLIFPLTPASGFGGMLYIKRHSNSYEASILTQAAFINCVGARDDAASAAVNAAFESKSFRAVRSLRRNNTPDHTVWCAGDGWWLSTAEAI